MDRPSGRPTGSRIVFYSQRGTDLDGRLRQSKIWMMASNGLNQRVVTGGESVAVSPEFLPNSRIIYSRRTAAGRWEIASVELDGSDARVESDPSSSDYRAPTKGPASGSFIVYSDGPVAADPAGGYRRSAGEATLFWEGRSWFRARRSEKRCLTGRSRSSPRYFAAVLHPDEDMLLHLGPPGPVSGPGGAPELLVSRPMEPNKGA